MPLPIDIFPPDPDRAVSGAVVKSVRTSPEATEESKGRAGKISKPPLAPRVERYPRPRGDHRWVAGCCHDRHRSSSCRKGRRDDMLQVAEVASSPWGGVHPHAECVAHLKPRMREGDGLASRHLHSCRRGVREATGFWRSSSRGAGRGARGPHEFGERGIQT